MRPRWIKPAQSIEVRFARSRAGAVGVALYRFAEVDALPTTRAEVDWKQLLGVGEGRPHSPEPAITATRLSGTSTPLPGRGRMRRDLSPAEGGLSAGRC